MFSDRHAYLSAAEFYRELEQLDRIDWEILRNRDFKRDPSDPGRMERYQAEALVHRHLPSDALTGIVCRNARTTDRVRDLVARTGSQVKVFTRAGYYL